MNHWVQPPQHPYYFYSLQSLFQKPVDEIDLLPAFRAAQHKGNLQINVSHTGVLITQTVHDEVCVLFWSGDFTPVQARGHWQCAAQRIYMIQAINFLKHYYPLCEVPEIKDAWQRVRDGLRPGSELWIS